MIRFIAAIDSKNGLAGEHGIPWQGKIPSDVKYFRDKTLKSTVLMGYGTYAEFRKPLPGRRNLVATSKAGPLLPGFEAVNNARGFLAAANSGIWVIGGAGLFASTLDLADELYLTRVEGDFHCTKFFPAFKSKFKLISSSEHHTENGTNFHFEIWQKT